MRTGEVLGGASRQEKIMKDRGYRLSRRTTHFGTIRHCLHVLTGERGQYQEMPCWPPVKDHVRTWRKSGHPLVWTAWLYGLSEQGRDSLLEFGRRWDLIVEVHTCSPHTGFPGYEYMVEITAMEGASAARGKTRRRR